MENVLEKLCLEKRLRGKKMKDGRKEGRKEGKKLSGQYTVVCKIGAKIWSFRDVVRMK